MPHAIPYETMDLMDHGAPWLLHIRIQASTPAEEPIIEKYHVSSLKTKHHLNDELDFERSDAMCFEIWTLRHVELQKQTIVFMLQYVM